MLKQLKNYFVLWENSTALQKFEAATKADAMKAARLYRRQWEITDDKPVKALNEAEAAAYEAERNAAAATTNQGKEEATMKKTTTSQEQNLFAAVAETTGAIIIEGGKDRATIYTPGEEVKSVPVAEVVEAAPAIEEAAAIIPEVLPPEQEQAAALIPAPLKEGATAANVPGEPLTVNERTLQLLKMQANLAAALPGVKSLQLVGRWLWLEFTGKPTAEIREQLKANKWTWAPKKGKWSYHNPEEPRPGKHRFMTLEEIKDKYGHAAII